jgi:hypothetical protein
MVSSKFLIFKIHAKEEVFAESVLFVEMQEEELFALVLVGL